MLNKLGYSILFALGFCFMTLAQNNKTTDEVDTSIMVVKDSTKTKRDPINVLAPSKAAFYSTLLPGLGQAYNKKYWKIPLVYVAIGIPTYLYIKNDKDYDLYRDAYRRRLSGFPQGSVGDPFPNVTDDGLIRAQQQLRRNKELALLIAIGMYALNIVDANVDAHLLQFNVDEDLSIRPHFRYNEMENNTNLGLTLDFKF
ncbi:hypothetical protein SAMN04515667_1906 [Formosa sp. Hel1_31_208]|uniref:DUF5683 domain-containing protein n=1 Tax=Formosa sp. Hel1_31_208 TaxID=1798225 RepID=UPI000879C871|nr:DUF5683 domain-containing protein [Formosa sp. Hel1_31_208]SDS31992.1 hypothetical protein SAMN04515667_1906 [Formosa sp. Hel1_31_208]